MVSCFLRKRCYFGVCCSEREAVGEQRCCCCLQQHPWKAAQLNSQQLKICGCGGRESVLLPLKGSKDCLTVPPSDACHNSTPGQGALPASGREPRAMGHPAAGVICLAWAKAAWRAGCLRGRKQSYLLARCTCLQLDGGIPFKHVCIWLSFVTRFWDNSQPRKCILFHVLLMPLMLNCQCSPVAVCAVSPQLSSLTCSVYPEHSHSETGLRGQIWQ